MEVLYSSEKSDGRLLQREEVLKKRKRKRKSEVGAWEVNSTSYRLIALSPSSCPLIALKEATSTATVQYYPALFPNWREPRQQPSVREDEGRGRYY
jgi:hypothetical protein